MNLQFLSYSLIVVLGISLYTPAQALTVTDEYALKAVFLFNLAKFITWPEQTFQYNEQKFQFCILGKTGFTHKTEKIIEAETVKRRSVDFIKTTRLDASMQHCQVVFISYHERQRIQEILQYFASKPVLMVSDTKDFVLNGGMVEFFKEKRRGETRIRIAMNPYSLRREKLRPSANLLRVATIPDSLQP